MRPPVLDRHALLGLTASLGHGLRGALRWGAHHSGLPIVLVAAVALVVSWRLLKKASRLAVEVAVAAALLVVATRLGWIAW